MVEQLSMKKKLKRLGVCIGDTYQPSLSVAAKTAGIDAYHGTAGRMLRNERYLGDDYYPAIIDEETYEKAEAERVKRAKS